MEKAADGLMQLPLADLLARFKKGKDGWLVWEGELVMDPVMALNADRDEHANG